MSSPSPHRRELGPVGFALAPLLQIGAALTITALGTVIGDNVMKETKINFANVPTQSSLNIVAASMAVSTTALALALLLISQCFAPQKPVSRYNETISNSLFIAGATPFLSLLAPVIGAYLSGLSFLYDSLYVGSASALGTTPLALVIFMTLGMGRIVSNCYQPDYNPAQEPPELATRGTQASASDTHVVQIDPVPTDAASANPLSARKLSHARTYSTDSVCSNSPIYRKQKLAFPNEESAVAQPQRFLLMPAPPAHKRDELVSNHPHRPHHSRCHRRTLTH